MSDLLAVEEWAAALLGQLDPAARRRLSRQIGRDLAKSQRDRVKANRNPDGSAFEARKTPSIIRDRKGAIRRTAKAGPMFRKLSRANELGVIQATADQVDVGFRRARSSAIARVHQEGLVDQVERARPNSPRVRYARRQLLGMTDAKREHLADLILSHLDT